MPDRTVTHIPVEKIKSKWYADILDQMKPDMQYISHLTQTIRQRKYIAPIVVTHEENAYYIVNGHHRYYAHAASGEKTVKCIVIDGTFADSEPLRKAEVLLKEFDSKTEYKYQFSGYLDRWAADAENHHFINRYRPTCKFQLYKRLKTLKNKLLTLKTKKNAEV
ncbi:MAG: ParB/RepB/Spo0J family partition protein [Candidatus Omnitrophota bacterium]